MNSPETILELYEPALWTSPLRAPRPIRRCRIRDPRLRSEALTNLTITIWKWPVADVELKGAVAKCLLMGVRAKCWESLENMLRQRSGRRSKLLAARTSPSSTAV